MEASPTLSTIEEVRSRGRSDEDVPEPWTHYLDRISNKEGYRPGVYWTSGDHYIGEWHENLRHGKIVHLLIQELGHQRCSEIFFLLAQILVHIEFKNEGIGT